MPGPYGSLANPVPLDPFQQIVEVHWSPKYLAVGIRVVFTPMSGVTLENFSIIGPDLVEPFDLFHTASIEASAASILSASVGNSGHWSSISTSDIEASGLPSPSSVSLGPWEWTYADGGGIKGPFDQWQAAAGIGGPYIEGPGGIEFNEGVEPSIALKGQQFLAGAPYWTPFFTNFGQWGTGATDGNPLIPLIVDITSQAFSLAGLSITYKEKTWHPIASKVSGATGYGEGSLMVLLKREDVTA